jgi:tetratricopeptide (TPR) repeat protein
VWALRERTRAGGEAERAGREAIAAGRERDKAEEFARFMEETLSGVRPSVALGRDTTVLKELMDGAAKKIRAGELKASPEAEVRLRLTIGGVYTDIAEYAAARDMLGPAENLARAVHGSGHEMTARVLSAEAELAEEEDHPDEVLPHAIEALAIYRGMHLGDDARVVHALHAVARAHQHLGNEDDSQRFFDEGLDMARRIGPEDSPLVSTALNNMGTHLADLHQYDKALATFQQARAMERRRGEGDSPNAAGTLENIAFCQRCLHNHAEGLAAYTEALEIRKRLHGGDHPRTARCLDGAGECLRGLSQEAEALPYFQRAVAMLRRLHPGDHRDTAVALFDLAGCLDALGRPHDALPEARDAVEMWRRMKAGDDPNTAQALNLLGKCLTSSGKAPEARDCFREALAMLRGLGPDDAEVARVLNNLGFALQQMGRPAEALPNYREGLELSRRFHPGASYEIARGLNNLGFCYMGLDQPVDALERFQEALAMYREVRASETLIAGALNNSAMALQSMDRPGEALPKFEEALDLQGRAAPGDHPFTAGLLANVGVCLLATHGDLERAEQLVHKSLDMYGRLYGGEDHPNTALTQTHLVGILRARRRLADAEDMARTACGLYRAHPDWDPGDASRARLALLETLEAADKREEAASIVREIVAETRGSNPAGDARLAGQLAQLGRTLLKMDSPAAAADAEPILQECLAIRERTIAADGPDAWLLPNTRSLLGEAVFRAAADPRITEQDRRDRFAAAEDLLVRAGEEIRPPEAFKVRLREALQRIVALYEAWNTFEPGRGHDAKATLWRARLDEMDQTSAAQGMPPAR